MKFNTGNTGNDLISGGALTYNAFLASYDTSGVYDWAFKIGNTTSLSANNILIDSKDNQYLIGSYVNTVDLDPSASVFELTNYSTSTFFAKYSVSSVVGLVELKSNSSVSVFPNPSSGIYQITNIDNNSTIIITDMLGKQIAQFENINSSNFEMDLRSCDNGLYIIVLFSKEKMIYRDKLIKD